MNENIINTNNVTVNAENAKATPAAEPMRDAIIVACETGNAHAITLVEAVMAGIDPKEFSKWTSYVEALRQTAIEYGKVADNKDSGKDQIELAKGRVWEKWQQILTIGEEDKFHPNMFTREQDADTCRVFACNMTTLNIPKIGTVAAVTPGKAFRKMIESFLGLRIRANAALCDADRDIILTYNNAKNAAAKAQERLVGRDTDDGHEPGLNEQLASVTISLSKSYDLLEGFGIPHEDAVKNPAIIALVAQKDNLESEVAKAKKAKADNEKIVAEKQEQYDRVIATINKIERVKQ